MKILITAKYVSGSAHEGGSSRFMRLVARELAKMQHSPILTDDPSFYIKEHFDLIICSHDRLEIGRTHV